MVYDLVRNFPIVLKDVVVLNILRYRNLLRHGQDFGELIIGDVVQFGAVVFRNNQLRNSVSGSVCFSS